MKYILLLLLAFSFVLTDDQEEEEFSSLFKLDLTNETNGLSQFGSFQSFDYAKVNKTDEGDEIVFTQLSRYAGIQTPAKDDEWIESPLKSYQITVYFRGKVGVRTGGFIGYISKEAANIVKTLALDQDQIMQYDQPIILDTEDGEWHKYMFYLEGFEGIKIILDQGDFFGLKEKYYCAFKGLLVTDIALGTDCPGDSLDKILKSYYFGEIFAAKNFKGRTQCDFVDHDDYAEVRFIYPSYYVPCVRTALFALDQYEKVIENFQPILYETEDKKKIHSYNFTLSQLENFKCSKENLTCEGASECYLYSCPVKMCYYLDYDKEFATRQLEYNWISENSYAIFESSIDVQVKKETETIFNTLIETYVNKQVCGDDCVLDMSLSLELKIRNDKGEYVLPGETPMTFTWGDMMYFQVTSDPNDYELSLNQVYVQTSEQQGKDSDLYQQLGKIFISSFVEITNQSPGKINFEMRASGEAGLSKGKPFNLKFLVHTDATGSRLLEETYGESSSNKPKAQVSGDLTIKINDDDDVKEGNSAFSLGCSIIFLLGLLFLF